MTVPPVACVEEVTVPARTLTAEEAERVDTVFATMALERQQNPDRTRVAFDPCLMNEFTWDNAAITDFVCGQPRLPCSIAGADGGARLVALRFHFERDRDAPCFAGAARSRSI